LPDDLVEALDSDKHRSGSFRKRFGQALAKRVDVRFGDYRLERAGEDSHTKVGRWKVRGLRDLRDTSEPHVRPFGNNIVEESKGKKEEARGSASGMYPANPANPAGAQPMELVS